MRFGMCLVAFSLVIAGCSSKTYTHVENDKLLDFGMANSKKVELRNADNTKTYVTVTYLNPIKHELINPTDTEKFVVGTYLATGEAKVQPVVLSNFAVNGSDENITVTKLDSNASYLSLIASANPWTEYLLIEAPYTSTRNMKISFENDRSEKVSVTLQKDF